MKYDDLDSRMRVYETAHDICVLPGMYMVARLDGRSFTKLTKEVYQFESPYDVRFRDMMLNTVEHLMKCGFSVVYGYTESDEISLLFSHEEGGFNRKLRKLNSVLAGEASAKFSLLLGGIGCFDCRIAELPNVDLVVDYFRWRNEDAHRNALNAHCYWCLRKDGLGVNDATAQLEGRSVADKNELLFQHGINFNDLPLWQRRGMGLYWEDYGKPAVNPITGQEVVARRRRICRNLELPMKDAYSDFVRQIAGAETSYTNAQLRELPRDASPTRGPFCEKCQTHIPVFADLTRSQEQEVRHLALDRPLQAMKRLRDITGCDLGWAKTWVLHPNGPRSKHEQDGPPCPICGEPLRTKEAKQCLSCGMDWHDPDNIVRHKSDD